MTRALGEPGGPTCHSPCHQALRLPSTLWWPLPIWKHLLLSLWGMETVKTTGEGSSLLSFLGLMFQLPPVATQHPEFVLLGPQCHMSICPCLGTRRRRLLASWAVLTPSLTGKPAHRDRG